MRSIQTPVPLIISALLAGAFWTSLMFWEQTLLQDRK